MTLPINSARLHTEARHSLPTYEEFANRLPLPSYEEATRRSLPLDEEPQEFSAPTQNAFSFLRSDSQYWHHIHEITAQTLVDNRQNDQRDWDAEHRRIDAVLLSDGIATPIDWNQPYLYAGSFFQRVIVDGRNENRLIYRAAIRAARNYQGVWCNGDRMNPETGDLLISVRRREGTTSCSVM